MKKESSDVGRTQGRKRFSGPIARQRKHIFALILEMVELCDANAPQKMEEFKGLYQKNKKKQKQKKRGEKLVNGRMAGVVTHSG